MIPIMAKVDVVGTKKITHAGERSVPGTRQLDPELPVAKVGSAGAEGVDFCRGRREVFVDDLMVRIHCIIEMILEDRPCAMSVGIHVSR